MAQFGRASALGAEGRRFKSCHSDHNHNDIMTNKGGGFKYGKFLG